MPGTISGSNMLVICSSCAFAVTVVSRWQGIAVPIGAPGIRLVLDLGLLLGVGEGGDHLLFEQLLPCGDRRRQLSRQYNNTAIQPCFQGRWHGVVRMSSSMCFDLSQLLEDALPLRQGLSGAEHRKERQVICSRDAKDASMS